MSYNIFASVVLMKFHDQLRETSASNQNFSLETNNIDMKGEERGADGLVFCLSGSETTPYHKI